MIPNEASRERIYAALVLNDYEGTPYAQWVKEGKKKIETRMGRLFTHRGDIVICCGAGKSVGPNAGNALCIVDLWYGRRMRNTPEEIEAACIGWDAARKSLLLKDWRYFSRDFKFAPQAIKKNFQGIFSISIPDDVEIIPQPQIMPYLDQFMEEDSIQLDTIFNL